MLELMSPAGSKESFIAALESGADSVYLGLKIFNARKPAKNFTIRELKQAKEYAKIVGKKIYLVLNIDLKSNELSDAIKIVKLCIDIKIDGVIIKDPAIFYIIDTFFQNEIDLHFSTQNGIESSYAVNHLAKMGVKRVVLAREMNFDEIKEAASNNDIEIEIFTEGSMCFSFSGRCFMSSFVGGKSGNRGQCQGPCRLNWQNGDNNFTFFSMKDMTLISYLKELSDINVKVIKIEGRLKNPNWVGEVTAIYRKALQNSDNKNELEELKNGLKKYSAREKDSGHLFSHKNLVGFNKNFQDYKKDQTFNNTLVNKIFDKQYKITSFLESEKMSIEIEVNETTKKLSFEIPPKPKKAKTLNIKDINRLLQNELKDYEITFLNKIDVDTDVNSSFLTKVTADIKREFEEMLNSEEALPELSSEIKDFINNKTTTPQRERQIGTVPNKILINPSQIKLFGNDKFPIDTFVIALSNDINIEMIKSKFDKPIFSIPPILFRDRAKAVFEMVKTLINNGFGAFEANSYTGIEMLELANCKEKYLGYEFGIINDIASEYFYKKGFISLYPSIESDQSILKSLSSFNKGKVDCLVFAKPILFYSRVSEEYYKDGEIFRDKFCVMRCFKENGINLFVDERPFSLIGKEFTHSNITFDNLTADLRYFSDPITILKKIYSNQGFHGETTTFNWARKLS